MSNSFSPKKIGFLGGGQLAQMMALRAHEMGHIPYVLSHSADDPAAQVVRNWVKGDVYSESDLIRFLKLVDIATFESEFLNAKTLASAVKKSKTTVYPRVTSMGPLQDRLSQKKLLVKHNIPTSPFLQIDSFEAAKNIWDTLGGAYVLKQRHHGYDGYGTFIIKKQSELPKLKQHITQNPHGFIAEKFIPFKRELAISIVCSANGDIQFLPLVESFQEEARCLWVKGPIQHKKITALKLKIKNFVTSLNYIGILAFEIFDCGEQLLINEIAPRVHNSAHYSQDALNFDQFQMHLLAITKQSLPKVISTSPGFAMYNLLGSKKTDKFKFTVTDNCHLHWYQKTTSRPGRKMGHLNCNDTTADKALNKLKKAREGFKL